MASTSLTVEKNRKRAKIVSMIVTYKYTRNFLRSHVIDLKFATYNRYYLYKLHEKFQVNLLKASKVIKKNVKSMQTLRQFWRSLYVGCARP